MPKRTLALVSALAFMGALALARGSRAQPAPVAPSARVFPFPYERCRLANGFTAYLITADTPGEIGYITVVRAGSREEMEPGKTGFAHLFEHLMFRGTRAHPNYGQEMGRIGARNNAFTETDMTVFHVAAASEYLETVMSIESDRFKNLDYSEADFRTEAGAVLGEYMQDRASPWDWLDEKTRETAFDTHTYRHTVIGYEADVRAMPADYAYSREFFRKYYRPENCVLVLAGDFDAARAKELIAKYYGDWTRGYTAPAVPAEPEQMAPRQAEVRFPGQTLPILNIAWKGPAWSATDRQVSGLYVLGEAGFGQSSDLYRKLVVEERKVQSLNAEFWPSRDPGLTSITAVVSDSSGVAAVEAEIEAEAARFGRELLDPHRLADTKSNIRYSFLMRMESPLGVAFSPLPFVVNTGGIEAVETSYQTLGQVTAEDVRSAAARWLNDRGKTVVVLRGTEAKS